MSEPSERFIEAVSAMEAVADEMTPEEARESFDDATLQTFWRDWTHISSWAGALWRLLSQDLEAPARPADENEYHDVGGPG